MMPKILPLIVAAAFASVAAAQTHKVAKTEDIVRAVGVYEWTGDIAKPAASRLIPVSLFINGKLEDAAIYLARPVPFALLSGNVYEIDDAGIAHGTLDLAYARHLQASEASTTNYDDGWFGYGVFVAPQPPRKAPVLKVSKTTPVITASDAPGRPHFSSDSATPGSGASSADKSKPAPSDSSSSDPDRPTMRRRADASSSSSPATPATPVKPDAASDSPPAITPAGDPERPTMHRNSDSSGSASGKTADAPSVTSAGSSPADDPDRPSLRRRPTPPSDSSTNDPKRPKPGTDVAGVTTTGSLNDDPNRPNLHRGKPTAAMTETELPRLVGLPPDLRQKVAVSDAANRPAHDFARPWEDEQQHQEILTKLEAAARTQLLAYAGKPAAPAAAPKPAPAPKSAPATRNRRPAAATPPPPAPEALLDEELRAYTLSYGGAATYVYSAHTDGLGTALRYVTLVAQVDMQSVPQIAMENVTDATHLDRTPRLKFVDAVDAEASNRASLLFELRGQTSRQFALYRVIGARAESIFTTGTTQ